MYCIMRTEKRKRSDITGIQKENTRTAREYNNQVQPGMDIFNVTLKESQGTWLQDIDREIKAAGAKARANSVLALDTIYTASEEFFQGKTNQQNDDFFRDCLKFHKQHFGHVISAVIHYDESNPHLHVVSVPLTKDNRLSARDVIGNKAKMSKTQDMFYEQVGKVYNLDRGERGDGQEKKKHISAQTYRAEQAEKRAAAAEQRATIAEERAVTAERKAADLHKQVEQLQEQRKQQHESLLMLSEARQKRQKEVKQLDYAIEDKEAEFEAIKGNIQEASKNLEALSGYLSKAEQEKAWEIVDRWNDDFTH